MKHKKYIATFWQDAYDYDGACSEFAVLNEFQSRDEGIAFIRTEAERSLKSELDKQHNWFEEELSQGCRPKFNDINREHCIVTSSSFLITDGGGFNKVYQYFDLIEIDEDTEVNKALFCIDGQCEREVEYYFDHPDIKKGGRLPMILVVP